MKKKITSKVSKSEHVVELPEPTGTVSKISKLEPFGNEEMHQLVAKINEIITCLNS